MSTTRDYCRYIKAYELHVEGYYCRWGGVDLRCSRAQGVGFIGFWVGALKAFGLQVQPIRLRVDFGASGSCLKRNLVTMAARGGESLDHDGVILC